ncbi:MAG: N-formylglutamate amidohydrolase [Rhodospirillales bacterium 70-18]|nr:N-formylglutamate amidohydrolase [Rhodospirillales bacterium]OJY76848.1 MAG: N-formylglutamate amidohydrolase [Rhodospirillales bacterium 70-18]
MDLPLPAAAASVAASLEPPPVLLARPARQTAPIVFASAHSGRAYSADFVAAARLDALRLRRSEDSFVDELFAAAPALGMPLACATFPRAYCDANREAWELDPAMFDDALPPWVNTASPRVGAGLGTIARVVASGEPIYRGKLRFAEAEARVQACWQPFHAALGGLVAQTVAQFGACLLIDCHSMPASALPPRGPADIVLGDAHGTACAPHLVRLVEQALTGLGFSVRRNDPYAGGYITRHYGHPRQGVHALQIEINRALYMDEARIERLDGFDALRDRLTRLMAQLANGANSLG